VFVFTVVIILAFATYSGDSSCSANLAKWSGGGP